MQQNFRRRANPLANTTNQKSAGSNNDKSKSSSECLFPVLVGILCAAALIVVYLALFSGRSGQEKASELADAKHDGAMGDLSNARDKIRAMKQGKIGSLFGEKNNPLFENMNNDNNNDNNNRMNNMPPGFGNMGDIFHRNKDNLADIDPREYEKYAEKMNRMRGNRDDMRNGMRDDMPRGGPNMGRPDMSRGDFRDPRDPRNNRYNRGPPGHRGAGHEKRFENMRDRMPNDRFNDMMNNGDMDMGDGPRGMPDRLREKMNRFAADGRAPFGDFLNNGNGNRDNRDNSDNSDNSDNGNGDIGNGDRFGGGGIDPLRARFGNERHGRRERDNLDDIREQLRNGMIDDADLEEIIQRKKQRLRERFSNANNDQNNIQNDNQNDQAP